MVYMLIVVWYLDDQVNCLGGNEPLLNSWFEKKNACQILTKYVTLDHKTSLKLHGYICSNSQKCIVRVKIIKIIRIYVCYTAQL